MTGYQDFLLLHRSTSEQAVTFHRTKHARLIKIDADPSFDRSVGPHFTEGLELPE